ncbi:hypothetical protein BCEN4_340006 [Burkholderia cenocepacia]|nr:hypothetical protein BCEN4_340006 [Burkholderia cenocepacia]
MVRTPCSASSVARIRCDTFDMAARYQKYDMTGQRPKYVPRMNYSANISDSYDWIRSHED